MAGLDHVVHCTSNFDGLRTTMAQIGFTLTPPAEHPFGTGNSLVQLDGFFLEFLHLPNPHLVPKVADGEFGFAAYNADYLKDGGEGISMLVFETADAAAEQARFVREGLDTYKTFDFSRLAKQPDGEEVTVGFSLAFATHADMPKAAFFYCQQHAPQYFWKSEYQRHANTAVAIGEVAMVATNPLHYAGFLEALSQGEIGCVSRQYGAGQDAAWCPGHVFSGRVSRQLTGLQRRRLPTGRCWPDTAFKWQTGKWP